MNKKRIGVLALQGAFKLHRPHIEQNHAEYVEVKSKSDFNALDALILPGGESGVMIKLLKRLDMWVCIASFDKPIWGICAGAILLAKHVSNPNQESFGLIDADIIRNAYGSQIESILISQVEQHSQNVNKEFTDKRTGIPNDVAESGGVDLNVALIRAPKFSRLGKEVEILSHWQNVPTGIKQGNIWLTTFHPELNQKFCSKWHGRFISNITQMK